jgi:beta-carotene ketolase (CrtW type)
MSRTMSDADVRRQTVVGLSLAALVIGAFVTLHVYAVFFFETTARSAVAVPFLVAALTWLSVGLFIVAHDAMHGSLAPFRPRLNAAVGQLCLGLYAGFSYHGLIGKHFAHHRHAGTANDPDYDAEHPRDFWPWYLKFFREYFGLRQLVVMATISTVYMFVLGATPANVIVFWAVPAILSSLQLFLFGTWLPHRDGEPDFTDRHRARSNDFSWLVSLLTCFHFGYHHEHHAHPSVPWWRLPQVRQAEKAAPVEA